MIYSSVELDDLFRECFGDILIKEFIYTEPFYYGSIRLQSDQYDLVFDVRIANVYPFQVTDNETIYFINKDLTEYSHVGKQGNICIHTFHSISIKEKLIGDINSLKGWIDKYYVRGEKDAHYEHINIPIENNKNSEKKVLYFTDVEHDFVAGDYGDFYYTPLKKSSVETKFNNPYVTYYLNYFEFGKTEIPCQWSSVYLNSTRALHKGIFVYLKSPPSTKNGHGFETWDQLQEIVPQQLFKYLYTLKLHQKKKKKENAYFSILLGYDIPTESGKTKPHWQWANISLDAIPTFGEKIDGEWVGKFSNDLISWDETRNFSYQYFFGRGRLADPIINSNILIIGVGAIGSSLAVSLARGGVKDIGLMDYDVKDADNVCRAEYVYDTGRTYKVTELINYILSITPFCEISHSQINGGFIKSLAPDYILHAKDILDNYDIIFNCSADNDVAYILDVIKPKSEVINLSITNHANDLVCITGKNIYRSIMTIFPLLKNDTTDLYNPTGCWSPTFKASYVDINALLQVAIKNINLKKEKGQTLRTFVVKATTEPNLEIKIEEY